MKNLFHLLLAFILPATAFSQVVTTEPAIVQRSSHDITITFHADRGNRGLAGVGSSTAVYAHTGVILSGSDQWQNAPSWGDNSAKYRLTYAGPDTWTLSIPSIQTYYGLTDAQAAAVSKLAFVFRTADNSREGKDEGNADIFVTVEPDGFAVKLSYSPNTTLLSEPTNVQLTVNSTAPASLKLYAGDASSEPIASADNTTQLTYTYRITTTGETAIIATGNDGNAVAEDVVTFNLAEASVAKDYPGGVPKMGTVDNGDGSATFCFAAPGKKSVMIVGDWNNYAYTNSQVMNYQDYDGYRYFWITLPGMADGTNHIYYYLVDNQISVGDPYAELVLDPWNDQYIPSDVFPDLPEYPSAIVSGTPLAIYNSRMNDYNWEINDFKGVDQSNLIIYELLVRDFTGTENQSLGNGTIAGVLGKLDYLKDLGVNAIELLPIMEFNGNNSWGYNTNFYFAPDKAYGTPDNYKLLVDEAHKRGMAVILDIVFNQTDGLHPWYQMYDPAQNPFYNASSPHAYSVLNDWNQDNPLVQQQFKDALKYWLTEYKVDGFRFDLVKGLGSNQSYDATYNPATNTWSGVTDAKTNSYNASRVARMKELHNAMREVRPDAYFINENLAGAQEENEMAQDGEINWANINHASCRYAAGQNSDANLSRFYAPLDSRTWGSTVSYAESHDEERMAYYVRQNGVSGVKGSTNMTMRRLGSVAAMMLTAPGAHMIWQFQELGADQSTKNADGGNNTDPKKVVWNYLNNAARAGLMNSYKEMCHLRNDNPEFFVQGIPTTTIACNTSNWNSGYYITLKAASDKAIYMVANPTTSNLTISLSGAVAGQPLKLLSASYGVTPTLIDTRVTLPAGAYAIYGTENTVDVDAISPDSETAKAYGGEGRIIVVGNYNHINAYNLSGSRVNPDNVASGIYIVDIDGTTSKVAVR